MTIQNKASFACDFAHKVRAMPEAELHRIIEEEVGRDLSGFMLQYAISQAFSHPDGTIGAVMAAFMLGYLIKTFEQKPLGESENPFTQKRGEA